MKKDSSSIANVLLVATTLAAVYLLFVLVFRAPGVQVASTEQAPNIASVSKKVGDHVTEAHPAAVGKTAVKHDQKPNPDEVVQMLKSGNERFYSGKATHPQADAARLALAKRGAVDLDHRHHEGRGRGDEGLVSRPRLLDVHQCVRVMRVTPDVDPKYTAETRAEALAQSPAEATISLF